VTAAHRAITAYQTSRGKQKEKRARTAAGWLMVAFKRSSQTKEYKER